MRNAPQTTSARFYLPTRCFILTLGDLAGLTFGARRRAERRIPQNRDIFNAIAAPKPECAGAGSGERRVETKTKNHFQTGRQPRPR